MFIELAEGKVTEAQAQAQRQLLDNIDDLEASETPESVMLSTVSSEQNKDRTDRAVVTPWLKFLWETYRTVLEILRNNARLEHMYQATAHQAFNFCRVYTRKTEFRRLCDLLRNHLQNVAKYSNQPHSINLNDPDTLQRHLDTRFNQLNVAADLELWQEAFRAVEDIHSLISMSKRPPKNVNSFAEDSHVRSSWRIIMSFLLVFLWCRIITCSLLLLGMFDHPCLHTNSSAITTSSAISQN